MKVTVVRRVELVVQMHVCRHVRAAVLTVAPPRAKRHATGVPVHVRETVLVHAQPLRIPKSINNYNLERELIWQAVVIIVMVSVQLVVRYLA